MNCGTLPYDEFVKSVKSFAAISNRISDGWILHEDHENYKTYVQKHTFLCNNNRLLKTEYVISYNVSFGVPSFSFNIWDSTGMLLSLDEIRAMTSLSINAKDFYSVVTQHEHAIFHRPYFVVHPCHTEELIQVFKDKTKNIIVTFLGLISPLVNLDLPLEYGL